MGTEIATERFSATDYGRFKQKLQEQLVTLRQTLCQPGFGVGPTTLGSELELFLIDAEGRPLPISQRVVDTANSPLITPEMGAFTVELATPPVSIERRPFSALDASIKVCIDQIQASALAHGARAVPISILPTFERHDFGAVTITDRPRYRALARALRAGRAAPFDIRIDGEQPLHLRCGDASMEAANTAFQMHLRICPAEFVRSFNAAMLLTAPVLAAAGNSPTFLGHRLWQETRVALFKQAGDDRPAYGDRALRMPPRIGFGNGWVRQDASELFAESVALHEPILPICTDAPRGEQRGAAPSLSELRLHHGTIWNWNRPVYDPVDGGHLRIELRALPAGPSVPDMLANAAFLVGSILALAPEMDALLPGFPFALAKRNFYRAAQYGLDAQLAWPQPSGAPAAWSARTLLESLLPRARSGLLAAGVAPVEADHYLGIFERRVRAGTTGARWQLSTLDALRSDGMQPREALRAMLERYARNAASGEPVHRWPRRSRLDRVPPRWARLQQLSDPNRRV